MKPLEPNPNTQPYTPEILAELLAAADRRINALSREVERSIGSRTSAPSGGDGAAPPPLAAPPVSPSRLKLPAMPDLRAAMPDLRAVVSRLTARWWRQGLGVLAIAAAIAVGAALVSEEEREPPETAAAAPAEPAAADPTPPSVAPTAARQSTSALTMTLSANAPCWVRAVADGVPTFERMLTVGETLEVRAQDQVVLRVGDAGALSVSVNGRAATTVGPRGQVVTRRFSRRDYANSAAD